MTMKDCIETEGLLIEEKTLEEDTKIEVGNPLKEDTLMEDFLIKMEGP